MRTTSRTERRTVAKPAGFPTNQTSAMSLKKELNGWLTTRTVWNHDDWLSLLADLRTKGYSDLIDTPKGQEAIGLYLEANKKCASC